jgi:phosphate transport system permease protein
MSDTLATKRFSLAEQQDSTRTTTEKVAASLGRRYAAERRFRAYGISAITLALLALVALFVTIGSNGYSAFIQTQIRLAVKIDPAVIDPSGARDPEVLSTADYAALIRQSLSERFPAAQSREERRDLAGLVSGAAAFELRGRVLDDPSLLGKTIELWFPVSDKLDVALKAGQKAVTERQIPWVEALESEGRMAQRFNTIFLTSGDSRSPEQAGILGAVMGSFLTMIVTLVLSFPVGVAAAIYLEEYAPKNAWTQMLEANINNLAAVPSIVFGLLGLAVFLNFFGMPRSAPVVGGVVLAIMTLPTIIIAGRAALKGVPPSIREAAYGLGASRIQMVFHHVLPLAMPGMLTGSIIGMARALGETAPLLMIGMVAFIVDIPQAFTDPSTVLPVQVYLWADSPERAFVEKTSGAIIVLLAFLILMNGVAIFLRNKFERRW